MDSPLPWLLAGTAVGIALVLAGRSVHRHVQARRSLRDAEAAQGAGFTTMLADAPLREAARPRPRRASRGKDPARVAARAAAREKAADVIAREAARVKAAREAVERRTPPHVLVVDDSSTIRMATGTLLERQGWRVSYAVDGMEALLRIASELPDAVVSDIEMPRMDGLSLVRQLLADPRTAGLPVVVVSSAEDRFRDEARRIGVTTLLAKPYEDESLLAPLRRALREQGALPS